MRRYFPVAVAAAVGAVLGAVAGRYTAPVRTVETRVENTEAIIQAVAQARREWERDVKTVTKTVYREGKPVERIVYRDSHAAGTTSGATSVTSTSSIESRSMTVVDPARPRWAIQGAVAPLDPSRFAVEGQIRVLGPIWLGAGVQKSDSLRPTLSARLEW